MCAKWLQSCSTLCDTVDRSPPGSSDHGILLARILEWVAISSLRDLPNPGIKAVSLMSPVLAGRFFTTEPPEKPVRGLRIQHSACTHILPCLVQYSTFNCD